MEPNQIIDSTRRWIEAIVIGLNLCPFARAVFNADVIRYTVSPATDEDTLLADLERELQFLVETPSETVETALLIHPFVLGNFLDYNDFLSRADDLVAELDLEGVFQIASFHPDYRFADTPADAVENYTNRSPYPLLHLLRESSITRVAGDPAELLAIPQRNIAALRNLGRKQVLARLQATRTPGDTGS